MFSKGENGIGAVNSAPRTAPAVLLRNLALTQTKASSIGYVSG